MKTVIRVALWTVVVLIAALLVLF